MSRKSNSLKIQKLSENYLRKWPLPALEEGVDKDGRGKVFIIAGSPEMPGALILTAESALRAGAGKVQVMAPKPIATAIGIAVPEALVIAGEVDKNGSFTKKLTPQTNKMLTANDVILIGPGMKSGVTTAAFMKNVITIAPEKTFVFDAEALKIFAKNPPWLNEKKLQAILTPHEGEMATMTGHTKAYVSKNAANVATEFAKATNTVVVLKGQKTYIASPDGEIFLNERGHKGLAAAGSGDTLAGLISGIAARGADPVQAAVWGVFAHALAGEHLAEIHGGIGFLTREIPAQVPKIIFTLQKR